MVQMNEEQVNSLEEEARKRQERLKSLKRKREDKNSDDKHETTKDSIGNLPKPKFRSYKPQDKSLVEHVMEKPGMNDVKTEVKDLLDLAKKDVVIDQLDISTLAPRQPDWDLKRDVEKKLEKLARRTQKAMAELIREKLKEKQELAQLPSEPTDV